MYVPICLKQEQLRCLLALAARRSVGQLYSGGPAYVVWAQGEGELALNLDEIDLQCSSGQLLMVLPAFCDQTGWAKVQVFFAVGAANRPAGLFAATQREPSGPDAIVNGWSEALLAFAWQVLLEVLADVAGATGKDARGNLLVPVELIAERGSLTLVPMARHRFSGRSNVLQPKRATRASGARGAESGRAKG